VKSTYYIVRFTDTGEALGRWDISAPYTRVHASYAACFDTLDKATRVSAMFPGTVVVEKS
jgi:hypothetical protein